MTDTAVPKIRVAGVSLRFGEKTVLDDVSLDVPERRNTVLIGSAASGKSVLLKCILGLHTPDAGRIEVDGEDTVHLRGDARIKLLERFGVLYQLSALFDSLPVWENIAFKLMNVHGLSRRSAREVAVEKLSHVGLSADVAALYPADLSGGMQKRVALARAIAGDPEILVLDDPTAGLDPIMTNQINRLIKNAVDELGATALCITGDMASVRRYYDNVAMIHEGRIIWSGRTDAIDAAGNDYLDQLIHGRAQGPIKMRLHAR